MSVVRLLVDNDVLLKAAHWDLLSLVPRTVEGTWGDTAVLPQFPPRVKRADPKLFKQPDVAARLYECVRQCAPFPEPEPTVLSALQSVPAIDAGEQLLLGALAATPGALLLTGDKRALRALAQPEVATQVSSCHGRVVCLDQWFLFAVDEIATAQLVAHFRLCIEADKVVLAIVGRTGDRTEAHLREGFGSYTAEITAACAPLLRTQRRC